MLVSKCTTILPRGKASLLPLRPCSRKSLIAATSALLRYRAEKLGMHPSEKFRNENGIGMQMTALEREMYKDTRTTWHTSALFREVGTLFREHPEQFDKKLEDVRGRWITPLSTEETSDA